MKITIGSRGSELALWQANHVKDRLVALGHQVAITIIKTQGDRIQHLSFDKMEGKGFFTKELEEALLNGSIDLAVHSHKDLPTQNPEGLTVAAVSEREDPAELLLIRNNMAHVTVDRLFKTGAANHASPNGDLSQLVGAELLPFGATVGTSSARRKAQLLHFLPDLNLIDLRGNVPTRVNKLLEGQYDAIMLAAAGIGRLGLDLSGLTAVRLNPEVFVPAPAQGVLALQTRSDQTQLIEALQPLNSTSVQKRLAVERGILAKFGGGCQIPLGAYCTESNDQLTVVACVADAHNAPVRTVRLRGVDAAALATEAVAQLKA